MSDDFFGPLPPKPKPPIRPRQPEWIGPRDNEVGVVVSVQFVLARTDDVAIVVRGGVAYSNGFEFRLLLQRRTAPAEFSDPFGRHPPRGRESDDEVLRFGVQFADGSKATTVGIWSAKPDDARGPRLTQRGGSGGGLTWHTDFWLWPLPPPGPLVFACAWPSESIPLTQHELDAEPILDASARVEVLWPQEDDEGTTGGSSWTTVGFGRR